MTTPTDPGLSTHLAGSTRPESVPVETVSVSAYTIPVDPPESDGTLEWDSHTIVLVEVSGAGRTGLGYSYTHTGAGNVVTDTLARVVAGRNALDVGGAWAAIGGDAELFVDANGAYSRAQALRWADLHAGYGARWFEEPVSSDDLDGLRLIRDRAPGGLAVAAGQYGWSLPYFHRMLDAGAVDCLQADVTRCGGITGFLRVSALCDARTLDLSGHCAPQVTADACAAVWHLRHLEYFHDHVLTEHLVFDGCLDPQPDGTLRPDRSRAGMGLSVRRRDIERWRVG